MAEARIEQLLAAAKTQLEGIVGDAGVNYWYTVHKVVRAPAFNALCLDSSVGSPATIYVLSPGSEEALSPFTFGREGSVANIDLTVVQRFEAPTENPFTPPDPDRWKVQTRLARDAEKRLRDAASTTRWYQAGDLATDIEIVAKDFDVEDTFIEGWAVAFLRVAVLYSYPETTP